MKKVRDTNARLPDHMQSNELRIHRVKVVQAGQSPVNLAEAPGRKQDYSLRQVRNAFEWRVACLGSS